MWFCFSSKVYGASRIEYGGNTNIPAKGKSRCFSHSSFYQDLSEYISLSCKIHETTKGLLQSPPFTKWCCMPLVACQNHASTKCVKQIVPQHALRFATIVYNIREQDHGWYMPQVVVITYRVASHALYILLCNVLSGVAREHDKGTQSNHFLSWMDFSTL